MNFPHKEPILWNFCILFLSVWTGFEQTVHSPVFWGAMSTLTVMLSTDKVYTNGVTSTYLTPGPTEATTIIQMGPVWHIQWLQVTKVL